MEHLPIELLEYCFNFFKFVDKVHFIQTCCYYNTYLLITDFYNLPIKYRKRLNDDILANKFYIKKLDIKNNKNVKKINHLINLQVLDCESNNIDDNQLKNLNLIELCANYNCMIKNIGHMTNLVKLKCAGTCGISDEDIQTLNLKNLDATNNNKIKKIDNMTNLRWLACGWDCGISDENIRNLNVS